MKRSTTPASTLQPGDLCTFRAPKEFIISGHVHLWSLSERCQRPVPLGSTALVLSVERSRLPKAHFDEDIFMALVHIDGLHFRLRADWLDLLADFS